MNKFEVTKINKAMTELKKSYNTLGSKILNLPTKEFFGTKLHKEMKSMGYRTCQQKNLSENCCYETHFIPLNPSLASTSVSIHSPSIISSSSSMGPASDSNIHGCIISSHHQVCGLVFGLSLTN